MYLKIIIEEWGYDEKEKGTCLDKKTPSANTLFRGSIFLVSHAVLCSPSFFEIPYMNKHDEVVKTIN
jgi:hypothetical protein